MNFKTFTSKLRLATGTDEFTLPKEDIAIHVNAELEDFSVLATLPSLQETYLGKEIPMNLETDKRAYDIPDNVIRIHRVHMNVWGQFMPLKEMTLSRMDAAFSEEAVQEFFQYRLPAYSIYADKLYIWTGDYITEETEWLKIFASVYPTEFIATDFTEENTAEMTTKSELPRQFHQVLLKRAIIAYKESRDKPIALTQSEQNYQWNLATVLKTMRVISMNRTYKMSEPKDGFYRTHRDPFSGNSQDIEMLLVDGDWVFLTA